jgi:hypothetical protein
MLYNECKHNILALVGKADKIAEVTYKKCGYGHLKSFGENVQPHCLVLLSF